MTREEIEQTALEAYPVQMMYGGDEPGYDANLKERIAFIHALCFAESLASTSFSHGDIPLHIKYKMYQDRQAAIAKKFYDQFK